MRIFYTPARNHKLKCLINCEGNISNKERKRKMFGINECPICGGADITVFPVIVVEELATVSILTPAETGCASIAISAMAGAR